jgi:hypothetical protein
MNMKISDLYKNCEDRIKKKWIEYIGVEITLYSLNTIYGICICCKWTNVILYTNSRRTHMKNMFTSIVICLQIYTK